MRKLKESRTEQRMAHYDAADVNGKLIILLRDIGHALRFFHEGKGSQKRILMLLLESGRITQRELTEMLGLQPGSVSEVIAKLENAGLVVRTSSTEDRRTADIVLSEEGKRQAMEACAQRGIRNAQMFSCLSEEEKTQLLSLLEKINRDWGTRYPGAAEMMKPPKRCLDSHGHPDKTPHFGHEE